MHRQHQLPSPPHQRLVDPGEQPVGRGATQQRRILIDNGDGRPQGSGHREVAEADETDPGAVQLVQRRDQGDRRL